MVQNGSANSRPGQTGKPGIQVEALEREVSQVSQASMAKSTWSSYSGGGGKSYSHFRSQLGFDQHVVAFVTHLSLFGKAASTISSCSAAFTHYHKINGWVGPTDNFCVRKLKDGYRRPGDHT